MRKKTNATNRRRVSRTSPKKEQVAQKSIVKQVDGLTDNQKKYIQSILDNTITVCIGPAGTGKSYIAAGICSELLHSGEYHQIIATRPLVSAGKDIGYLPGEMRDKIAPYLKPMEEHIKSFLGTSYYGFYFNEGNIRYEPLELMRGATFDNCLMILDEAQNCSLDQIKMFITRMGKDSKVIINGDTRQTDIKSKTGLETLANKISHIKSVGICKFTYEDIQRNGIIGEILRALEDE